VTQILESPLYERWLIGSYQKQRHLPYTCHSASPAIGVNIAAKDATSEINLTKHFVAREGRSQSERAYAKRIFRRNYLNGCDSASAVRKAIKKGPPQCRQGEYVVERIIRRTTP
jgi:hypothetical protein